MHFQLDIFFGFVHHYYISVAGFLVDEKKKNEHNFNRMQNQMKTATYCSCSVRVWHLE